MSQFHLYNPFVLSVAQRSQSIFATSFDFGDVTAYAQDERTLIETPRFA